MNTDPRQACANLVAAFAYHVDHREFGHAVALFAEDGHFDRSDLKAQGHVAIAAIWADRPKSVVTKHVCSLPYFTSVSANRVTSVTSFTLYHVTHDGVGLPKFDRPAAIAEFHDEFHRIGAEWRIHSRRGLPILLPA